MAESQISHSLKQFIHAAVTQKQHQLVPLRRDPSKGTPRLLHSHSLSHMRISLLLMSLCSCCVSQCPFTWLAQPKHWQFMASCLRFPLTAPSISQSAPHQSLLPWAQPCTWCPWLRVTPTSIIRVFNQNSQFD